MDKKDLAIIAACIALLLLFQPIMDFVWPSKIKHQPHVVSTTTNQTNSARLPEPAVSTPPLTSSIIPAATNSLTSANTISIENDLERVEFTSAGGAIKQVALKKYSEADGLVTINIHSPLPILDAELGNIQFLRPFELKPVSATQLEAFATTANGLKVTKQYSLESNYVVRATLTFQNTGSAAVTNAQMRVSLGMASPLDKRDLGQYIGLSFLSGEKAVHDTLAGVDSQIKKQNKPYQREQPIDWAALKDQYFITIITPNTAFAGLQSQTVNLPEIPDYKSKVVKGLVGSIYSSQTDIPPGGSLTIDFTVYTGPKEHSALATLGKQQQQALNLGMFGSLLLSLMTFFHGFLHNWGWSIVAVTVFLKLILWPLTAMGVRNMKQMQQLAPKVNALKEKYKDNSQKVNEEMMKLYSAHRINPLTGCLPMLVQIPIFYGFYSMLSGSIELRGAPFLWIKDLSIPDTMFWIPLPAALANSDIPLFFTQIHLGTGIPINPLPLIMACTQIWQARITPQAPNADPSMKMMMWFMPAMFLFICYNFSSGLSLYWTMQNLLTIAQTYYTKDKPVDPPQKVKRKGGFSFSRPT